MSGSFKGFSPELFKFLTDLAANNNRDWFNENKDRYKKRVVAPVCEFIEAMQPRLAGISASFIADPKPHGGSMFRIYRDARFSKDKRPYKEHVGCQFRHEAGRDAHAPGFYVHLAPHEVFFGAGTWMPAPPALDKIRMAIYDNPRAWSNVVNKKALKDSFGGVGGEGLKRPPKGYQADHQHIEDIKRKSFFLMREVDPAKALKPEFIEEVSEAFTVAMPMVRFVTEALDLQCRPGKRKKA